MKQQNGSYRCPSKCRIDLVVTVWVRYRLPQFLSRNCLGFRSPPVPVQRWLGFEQIKWTSNTLEPLIHQHITCWRFWVQSEREREKEKKKMKVLSAQKYEDQRFKESEPSRARWSFFWVSVLLRGRAFIPGTLWFETVGPRTAKISALTSVENVFSDVLALAASIGELTAHTKRARTANWCALQMADKENPSLASVPDLNLDNPVKLRPYTKPSAEEATSASAAANVLSLPAATTTPPSALSLSSSSVSAAVMATAGATAMTMPQWFCKACGVVKELMGVLSLMLLLLLFLWTELEFRAICCVVFGAALDGSLAGMPWEIYVYATMKSVLIIREPRRERIIMSSECWSCPVSSVVDGIMHTSAKAREDNVYIWILLVFFVLSHHHCLFGRK